MEFNQYNTTVQQWIHTVLENRETNAEEITPEQLLTGKGIDPVHPKAAQTLRPYP